MKPKAVPVTMGSARSRSLDTGGCLITEAWFPPHAVLEPHTHPRPIFAVMLHGGFRTSLGRHHLDCSAQSAWTEPPEERHANQTAPDGAHVVIVQPDPRREDLFGLFARLTDEVHLVRNPMVAADARRLAGELDAGDTLSALAADALVMGMLATAARLMFQGRCDERAPRWLLQARDMLHAHCRERLRLSHVAGAAGVHPSHLAHAFRAHFGLSLGAYTRKLRCEWAAEQLVQSDLSISEIAMSAGYSDQSHFTRECRRQLGMGPGAYRRRTRENSRTS